MAHVIEEWITEYDLIVSKYSDKTYKVKDSQGRDYVLEPGTPLKNKKEVNKILRWYYNRYVK